MNSLKRILTRGHLLLTNAKEACQRLQIGLLAGEQKSAVEHVEPYGFTSHAHRGAEVLAAFFGGDRSHGVVITVADRRYRLKGLKEGEVAIFDDVGQKVWLTREGILIESAKRITGRAPEALWDVQKSTFTGDVIIQKGVAVAEGCTVSGSIHADGDVTAGSISLQNHVHSGVQGGPSNTGGPQ